MKILDLVKKYKSVIAYLFFGVLTTIINLASYTLTYHGLGWSSDLSTVVAWILAVVVAFLTNKPFVFQSHDWSLPVLRRELTAFFGCRIGTGLLEVAMMHIFVEMLHFPGVPMKLFTNVIVVILNYVGSRLLVFLHRD